MAYYPDLSPCSYFGKQNTDKLVAIGWLDSEHPYTKGETNAKITDKLFELLKEPWTPLALMGDEPCPLCKQDINSITFNEKTINVGNLNLFIPGEAFLYVAPSLIAHYILSHNYTPPMEFSNAVLSCPPMGSRDYYQAIVKHGPIRYINLVNSQYLKE